MSKVLKVGVAMGGVRDESAIPLPDGWESMTEKERDAWADEALDVHVSNNVNAWWNVEDE